MSKSTFEVKPEPIVLRQGEQIVIPAELPIKSAITLLTRQMESEEQVIQIERQYKDVPPVDAVLAIQKAMAKEFHWVDAQTIPGGFFSPEQPPRQVSVSAGPDGEQIQIQVGAFVLHALENAEVRVGYNHDFAYFAVRAKRKYEARLVRMLTNAEQIMRRESLYRGKALKFEQVPLPDPETGKMAMYDKVGFLRLRDENTLVLNRDTEKALQANLWTLIEQREAAVRLGVPQKRAILLHGTFGVGKTLIAHRTAHVTERAGYTFTYVTNAAFAKAGYEFATRLAPGVLFVEDIDQFLANGEQAVGILSNVIDGIESKGGSVILVATTNYIERIPAILLRPGRFDAVLEIAAPDTDAVERLIRQYLPTLNGSTADAVRLLTGQIPAVIREACERAKLWALADGRTEANADDLLASAKSLNHHLGILNRALTPKVVTRAERFSKDLAALTSGESRHADTKVDDPDAQGERVTLIQ